MSSKKLKRTKFQIQTKINRTFSESFKRAKVKEIVEKRMTVQEVSDLYQVSRTSVYKWLYKYSTLERGCKQVVQMESEALLNKRLKEQIAELERTIGQKQLEIDFLNKTLEIAGEEVGYDLKKKYGPKSLNGLKSTEMNWVID